MTTKARVGRPTVPKKLAKGSLLSVRFSESERRLIERAAGEHGLRISEWSRRVLLAAAAATDGGRREAGVGLL